MKNQRVLITGGAGFIGSELVRQIAVQRTTQVIVVDNLVNGKRENLKDLPADNIQLVVADIRDTDRMAELMSGVDIVFHLACLGVRHSIHSPFENHEVNATATLQLLMTARNAGVSRFVYVSSSEVYGTARWVPMTEEHPTWPMTVYGSAKLAGECYTRAFFETYGYPTVVVRPFNSFGPRCHHEGDSGEVIPKFLLRSMAGHPMVILGDGTQSGFEITINDLAKEIASIVNRPDVAVIHDEPRPGDVLRLYAETTKGQEVLGFKPQVSLHEGLEKLRDWYMSLEESMESLLENEFVRNWDLQKVKLDA
jgi:UDP-glucose 4-epimerase